MNEENNILFREEQKFSLWLRSILFLMALLFIFLFSIDFSRQAPSAIPKVIGLVIFIGIAVLFFLIKMETEVRLDGLYVCYSPFHLQFRKISRDDLSEFYARNYQPIIEYGGWGLRGSIRSGGAYNVRGSKGVQLVFKNGKKLLLGSQKSQELEEAIRSII